MLVKTPSLSTQQLFVIVPAFNWEYNAGNCTDRNKCSSFLFTKIFILQKQNYLNELSYTFIWVLYLINCISEHFLAL